jgi:hypothetical protein
MMVTEPTKIFLMLWTAATIALAAAGTGASALRFFSVLRRPPAVPEHERPGHRAAAL